MKCFQRQVTHQIRELIGPHAATTLREGSSSTSDTSLAQKKRRHIQSVFIIPLLVSVAFFPEACHLIDSLVIYGKETIETVLNSQVFDCRCFRFLQL